MTRIRLFLSFIVLVFVATTIASADGYRITVGVKPDSFPLLVVKGTPYQMGFAQGKLLKKDVAASLRSYLGKAQADPSGNFTDAKLDEAWNCVKPYTSPRFTQELHGLADGTGLNYKMLLRAHMVPVVADFACSGAACWGSATKNGDLYQFRDLDYEMNAGLQDHPEVVIYLPDKGIAHVNVTFAGFIGSNTGMNADGIVLTEMGDSPDSDRPFNLHGVHFTTMFRDILYDAHNLNQAINIVKKAKRIKKYHYIIGDGRTKEAVKMLAHAPNLVIWHDNDSKDEVAPNILKDVVYNCETRDPVGYAYLKDNYGSYDADSMIQLADSVGTRHGNLLSVVYDATTLNLWVSYAEGNQCAYRRPRVHINMNDYLDFSKIPHGAVVYRGGK